MQEYTKLTGFDIRGRGGKLHQRLLVGRREDPVRFPHAWLPNLFMISAIQASATYNYLHVTDEQGRHLAQLIRTLLEQKVRTIEPTEEDQAA